MNIITLAMPFAALVACIPAGLCCVYRTNETWTAFKKWWLLIPIMLSGGAVAATTLYYIS